MKNQRLIAAAICLISSVQSAVKPRKVLKFKKACVAGEQIVVSAVGDILLHGGLQIKAARNKDFKVLWKTLLPYFKVSDVSYANLEGPAAKGMAWIKNVGFRARKDPGHRYDKKVYTSYPLFNYHPSLIGDLVDSGIDVVSTANNHSLDRGKLGVNRTIDALEKHESNIVFSGTRKVGETRYDRPWMAVTKQGGMTIGWISCTYGTNGIKDKKGQVLYCFGKKGRARVLSSIKRNKNKVDAIIVTPHWGEEYTHKPNGGQVYFAKQVLDAGATAVIGAHPHVLQPMDKYTTKDGRETFIHYSLGNFISRQNHLAKRSSMILFLGLTRTDNGVHVNGVKYLPIAVSGHGPYNQVTPLRKSGSWGGKVQRHILKYFANEHRLKSVENPKKPVTNDHCF